MTNEFIYRIVEGYYCFNRMTQAVKDISAGAVSGWTQVMIMQPFEIIKVRLQTQDSKKP